MPPHNKPTHIQQTKHADHKHIVKRLEDYIKVYRSGDPKAMMQFYHPENLTFSNFSTDRQGLGHEEVEKLYHDTFNNFQELDIQTLSVHGHKDFTAWEWEITCKPIIPEDMDIKISQEEVPPMKLVGCTLMWWENDKIIRNHDYVQVKGATMK